MYVTYFTCYILKRKEKMYVTYFTSCSAVLPSFWSLLLMYACLSLTSYYLLIGERRNHEISWTERLCHALFACRKGSGSHWWSNWSAKLNCIPPSRKSYACTKCDYASCNGLVICIVWPNSETYIFPRPCFAWSVKKNFVAMSVHITQGSKFLSQVIILFSYQMPSSTCYLDVYIQKYLDKE